MKIMALDVGDSWTGVALSDALGILAKPYTTIKTKDIDDFLVKIINDEPISIIVIGLPTTLRGTESEQTKKIIAFTQEIEQKFPTVTWKLWDERLTSKQAATIKSAKTKSDKLHSHAIAAALILSGYLEFQRFHSDSLNADPY